MARTAIAVNRAVKNATLAFSTTAGEGLTGSIGMYIPASGTPDDTCVLYVKETNGGATGHICIKAGSNVANAGQGDLRVIISASSENLVSLERTRFGIGATGTINVDLWGFTGTFAVINTRTAG